MSEIPLSTFDHVPDHEVDHLIETVDAFLGRPVSIDEPRSYMWRYDENGREGLCAIRCELDQDSHEYLMVTKVLVDPETNKLNTTKYMLAIDARAFMATRELHDDMESLMGKGSDDDTDPDGLLMAMGLMKPATGDWEDFIDVIHQGYVQYSVND
jgi:hypothetical protein